MSARAAAQTSVYCAVAKELGGVSGKYFRRCRVSLESSLTSDSRLTAQLWHVRHRWHITVIVDADRSTLKRRCAALRDALRCVAWRAKVGLIAGTICDSLALATHRAARHMWKRCFDCFIKKRIVKSDLSNDAIRFIHCFRSDSR